MNDIDMHLLGSDCHLFSAVNLSISLMGLRKTVEILYRITCFRAEIAT